MADPILLLDFARTRRFDRRLVFARSAPAWRDGAATPLRAVPAGQPRLDPCGLLLEPAATNLVLHNAALDRTEWLRTNVTVAPAAAPDGSLTAWRLAETTTSGSHRLFQRNLAGEGPHTASAYVKAAERSVVRLRINTTDGAATGGFNLADGTQLGDSAAGSTITPVGDGWYRITVSRTIHGTDSFVALFLAADAGPMVSYAGDPACGLLVWNVQLEPGSLASSPIATAAAAVTRPAESVSLPLDRLPRWAPAAGTLLVEATLPTLPAEAQTLAALSDPGGGNRLRLHLPGGAEVRASAEAGGAVDLAAGVATVATRFRAALAWDADGLAACMDGGAVTGGAGGVPGGLTALHLGHASGDEHAHARLGRVALYGERLPDAVLRRLTQA